MPLGDVATLAEARRVVLIALGDQEVDIVERATVSPLRDLATAAGGSTV